MYDFIIIGGGIVGMSTAMHLIKVYPEAKILLLEKESGPARHQTGHNSGVIHAGVYYTPGSLKARFCLEGNKATKAFCTQHGIRFDECGKLLVATNELEMQRMKALWERTAANGLERYWLSADELREREPNIVGMGASSCVQRHRQLRRSNRCNGRRIPACRRRDSLWRRGDRPAGARQRSGRAHSARRVP